MIEAVLFDLGNVLVEFDNAPIARKLAARATRAPYQDPVEVGRYVFHREKGAENSFDRGQISPAAFFQEIAQEMGLNLSYHEFVSIWNDIFRARTGAEEVVRFLHGRVAMHLLSNTNVLHFEYLLREFPWLGLMDSWFLSHEMGYRKPSPEVYAKVLKGVACPAGEILYLDDLEENLIPARVLGMRLAWVQEGNSIKELLKGLLPHLPWDRCGGEA
jgi:HAD superfamily hydrolase (TIGR01509 family)